MDSPRKGGNGFISANFAEFYDPVFLSRHHPWLLQTKAESGSSICEIETIPCQVLNWSFMVFWL